MISRRSLFKSGLAMLALVGIGAKTKSSQGSTESHPTEIDTADWPRPARLVLTEEEEFELNVHNFILEYRDSVPAIRASGTMKKTELIARWTRGAGTLYFGPEPIQLKDLTFIMSRHRSGMFSEWEIQTGGECPLPPSAQFRRVTLYQNEIEQEHTAPRWMKLPNGDRMRIS